MPALRPRSLESSGLRARADPQTVFLGRGGERQNPLLRRDPKIGVISDQDIAINVEIVAQLSKVRGGADQDAALDHAAEHGLQAGFAGGRKSVVAGADAAS